MTHRWKRLYISNGYQIVTYEECEKKAHQSSHKQEAAGRHRAGKSNLYSLHMMSIVSSNEQGACQRTSPCSINVEADNELPSVNAMTYLPLTLAR